MRRITDNSFEVDTLDLPEIFNRRNPDTTKKDYGHALLIAGSLGRMGAAVLAAKACMRSGVGLLTVHIPACGYEILQATVPEAMASIDKSDYHLTSLPDNLSRYSAIAIGPGIGTHRQTASLLKSLLKAIANLNESQQPTLILDADALNIVAANPKTFLPLLPVGTIITPHASEYQRLFQTEEPLSVAQRCQLTVVQKAHHTHTVSHQGQVFINKTGNAGMATAGSGDVLTGITLALAAQRMTPVIAAMIAVYIHGLAADKACRTQSQASLTASDIIENLKTATL